MVGFAVIEIGGLDDVKDALGSGDDDDFVAEIAERLRAAMPRHAAIGRLRSGRFGLVIAARGARGGRHRQGGARGVLARLLAQPGRRDQRQCGPGDLRRDDGTTRGVLRHRADLALRAARRRGARRGGLPSRPTWKRSSRSDSFIKRELARAMDARALDVHYQPIVKADGGAIVGVEALAALAPCRSAATSRRPSSCGWRRRLG